MQNFYTYAQAHRELVESSNTYQKLEVKSERSFNFSKTEVIQMNESLKSNFIEGFNNSSPEVQAALLKATEEVVKKNKNEK